MSRTFDSQRLRDAGLGSRLLILHEHKCGDCALCSVKAVKVNNPCHNWYAHVLLREHHHDTNLGQLMTSAYVQRHEPHIQSSDVRALGWAALSEG